ncbi:unnamed protein product [Orchesella dallaii]|uniref:C2H2-type domain-containing protein n=1 Tax=Orchesella dallaii TaxID=48710 RepID=A0ABP1QN11_9HEXA
MAHNSKERSKRKKRNCSPLIEIIDLEPNAGSGGIQIKTKGFDNDDTNKEEVQTQVLNPDKNLQRMSTVSDIEQRIESSMIKRFIALQEVMNDKTKEQMKTLRDELVAAKMKIEEMGMQMDGMKHKVKICEKKINSLNNVVNVLMSTANEKKATTDLMVKGGTGSQQNGRENFLDESAEGLGLGPSNKKLFRGSGDDAPLGYRVPDIEPPTCDVKLDLDSHTKVHEYNVVDVGGGMSVYECNQLHCGERFMAKWLISMHLRQFHANSSKT